MVEGTHSYSGVCGINDRGQVVDTSKRLLTLSTNCPFAIRYSNYVTDGVRRIIRIIANAN